ncbi:VWA domain-containing protein [Halovivax cerinus]|uniref:VWA domain-containing protein n=2 Tax=Halovivax cerinus TaxID=1487865 RepID=A0ABD5NPT4_9EURY
MNSGGERLGAGDEGGNQPASGQERGVSPTVGIILLFGMVLIGASVVALAGMALVDDLQTSTSDEQGEQVLRQVDHDIASEKGAIELLNDGGYNITDEGRINVSVTTWSGTRCTLLNESMGTLRSQRSDGSTIAHQAGGLFQKTDSGSRVLSGPDIRYYTTEAGGEEVNGVQLSLTDLQGTAGSGTHRASYERASSDACTDEVNEATEIELTVDGSPYHQGWAQFFNSTFGDTHVTYDGSQQKVTATASLGAAQPFESFIDLDPTIYGGLYAEETGPIGDRLTVDRYDGSVGWDGTDPDNITEDLFITNESLALEGTGTVDGVPVANGQLTGVPGADVTTVGYATAFDVSSFGDDTQTGTPLYNVTGTYPADVYGAKLDTTFAPIPSIDANISRAITTIDQQNPTRIDDPLSVPSGESTALYRPNGNGRIGAGQIDTIDTSGGTIHIGASNGANFDGVTVTGDGQAHVYVDGPITLTDVTIDDERARSLWVYGTEDATIKIEGKFHGVLYAPGSEVTIEEDAEIYGAVVGGETDIGGDATVHFDRTLRTDVPIPQANRGLEIPHPGERKPVDVMFALDRSGSMELYQYEYVGRNWIEPSFTGRFRVHPSERFSVDVRGSGGVRTVEPGESGVIEPGDETRVGCHSCDRQFVYISTQNDPSGQRIDATRAFVGQMKPGDKAGAVEFNRYASPLTDRLYTHSNFDDFNESLEANANGGTYIGAGIDEALEYYDPTDDSEKIMIVLTDGRNDGRDEDGSETRELAGDAATDNVTIYTVGLGDERDIDEELLMDIADITGGNYTHVSNASELNELFRNIGEDVQERNMTALSVNSFESTADWSNEFAIEVRTTTVTIDD